VAADRSKWVPTEPVVPARRDVALAEIKRQLDAGVNPVVLSPEVGAWFVDAMEGSTNLGVTFRRRRPAE
jgi:hypothetical protein